MAVGTKFYIRIPVDKVTEDAKSIVLTATGIFKSYEGYYYTSDDNCQVITNVRTITSSLSDGLTYDINYTPEVPDTNKNVAQSIYFIGLIIMLSGVGVIYANVKPKAKQQ